MNHKKGIISEDLIPQRIELKYLDMESLSMDKNQQHNFLFIFSEVIFVLQ